MVFSFKDLKDGEKTKRGSVSTEPGEKKDEPKHLEVGEDNQEEDVITPEPNGEESNTGEEETSRDDKPDPDVAPTVPAVSGKSPKRERQLSYNTFEVIE